MTLKFTFRGLQPSKTLEDTSLVFYRLFWPLLLQIAWGEPVVVDWESGLGCAPEWSEDGLIVRNGRGTICTTKGSSTSNGTTICSDTDDLEIRHRAGMRFTPKSVDLGEYGRARSIIFVGQREDGSVTSITFTLDGKFDGPGGIEDFQTFDFPSEFEDLITLRVVGKGVYLDNVEVDTVLPPPIPAEDPPTAFSHLRTLHVESEEIFLVGPDFACNIGFRPGSWVRFVSPPQRSISGYDFWWDPERRVLMHGQGGVLQESTVRSSSNLVTLSEVQAAGFVVSSISSPRRVDGGVLFFGFSYIGNDDFYILRKEGGTIREIVGPSTAIPNGASTSPPYRFPDFLAARGKSYAFDTTLGPTYSSIDRLVGSFNGGSLRILSTAGEPLGPAELGSMKSINDLIFNRDGLLEARLSTSTGDFLVYFGGSSGSLVGWRKLSSGPLVIEDIGGVRSGSLWWSATGVEIMVSPSRNEIFRKHRGQWFRVLGVGDMLNGRKIGYLNFKTLPQDPPARIIVEVRYETAPSGFHAEEIRLETPVDHPPRVRQMVYQKEAEGFFITLDRLTAGNGIRMEKSENLSQWEQVWEMDSVAPVYQFFVPRSEPEESMFYRWAEVAR